MSLSVRTCGLAVVLGAAGILLPFDVGAQSAPGAHQNHHAAPAETAAATLSIPDVEVQDQDGRHIHFYSDLVKGHVVAVNFIFTTCTTICPPLGVTYGRLQSILQQRDAGDVRLISVTVDPVNDTPDRLTQWAAKFHARPGWTLITGPRPNIERLLRALNENSPYPLDHSPNVLIGNEATGTWKRASGLAPAAKLAELILGLRNSPDMNTSKKEAVR
jgi:protein SCO1/2